jgi:hypothetical protein
MGQTPFPFLRRRQFSSITALRLMQQPLNSRIRLTV